MSANAGAYGNQKDRSIVCKPIKDGKTVEIATESHHRSPKPSKKPQQLRQEGKYTEAIREYQNRIEKLTKNPQRHVDLLKLRCHVGSCLLESMQRNHITTSEVEFEYAESYLRETLGEWQAIEGKDCDVGVVTTQDDLAQCLVRHAEFKAAHGHEKTAHGKVKEAVALFEDVLSYRKKHCQRDDGSIELVLADLFAANLELSKKDWHHVEQFSRRELQKLKRTPTLYSENATIALKRHLADALFEQKVYGEARLLYNDIIQLLKERRDKKELKEYMGFVKAISRRRWYLAWDYARDEVWRRRLATYRKIWGTTKSRQGETHPLSKGIFFGARNSPGYDNVDKSARAQAAKWMNAYGSFCNKLATNSRTQSGNFPVKVAVIDTGIDATNAFVDSRWLCQGRSKERWDRMSELERIAWQTKRRMKCYKDFLDSPSDLPSDEDGHGTHISGLILRYAPNAHLYVARVARTQSSCQSDLEFERRVVDAVKWALEKCRVDIVSLSFTLRDSVSKIDLDKLIEQANSSEKDGKQKKKTIIVAAACNEGGREPVPYPANHDSVINVRALTGYGKDADFTPYPRKYDPNFSILGTQVLSTWPNHLRNPLQLASDGAKLRDVEGIGCMTNCMDGTSFSAPLVVALIANVFAFYIEHKRQIVPQEFQVDDYRYEAQNLKAVRNILLHMSIEQEKINVVSPWETRHFLMRKERDRTVGELCTAIRWALESE